MNEYIINIRDLHKTYENGRKKTDVLKGINLKISRGEFFCIQGPSGAGKSTLLNLIGMLDRPSSGEILFEGFDINKSNENKMAELRNKKIGFVFQLYHLIPEFTALENTMLPALISSWWRRHDKIRYAREIFDQMGLSERADYLPTQLSGGEQQRVAIARALINGPDVLLCDEPTGNLDSDNGKKILNILRQLNKEKNTTVVIVTHDSDIARLCDTVMYLRDGKIEAKTMH